MQFRKMWFVAIAVTGGLCTMKLSTEEKDGISLFQDYEAKSDLDKAT
jgi:hypothetical protein